MSELPTCFMDVPLRFWAKIEVDHGSGCWLWTARRSTDGYGQVVFARQNRPAHRVCYEALRGRIEPQAGGRIVLDHLCRVRRCVNPDHLRPVSDRENTLAEGSLSLAAIRAAQTHCSRGHRLADPNLVPSEVARGLRNCLACNRATATVRHAKKSGRVLDVQTVADERYRAITEQGTTA